MKLLQENKHPVLKPSWDQVKEALNELDGSTTTLVGLIMEGKAELYIGGGDNHRYVVNYQPADNLDGPSWTLTDPDLDGPEVELTAQTPSKFPATHAVHFPLMLRACRSFFATGERNLDLEWESDY